MKSVGQLLLGLIAAVGTGILVLAAASLALVEGGIQTAGPASPVPLEPSATGLVLTLTTQTPQPFTLTPTQVQPTSCPTPEGWGQYLIQPGDTLESIAEQVGLTVEQIQKANCLSGTSLIPNTILYLPNIQPTATAPTALPTALPTQLPSVTPIPCGPPAGWVVYTVRPGDTLFRLSLAFGVSQYQLQTANCMTGTQLRAGQTLYVPNVPTRVPNFTNTPTQEPVPSDTPETPTVEVPTTAVPSPTDEPTLEPTVTDTVAPSAIPVTPTSTPEVQATTPTPRSVEVGTETPATPSSQ